MFIILFKDRTSILFPPNLLFNAELQILDWLSNSPTDIESYIRPGCIILTIYLCQAESAWVQVNFRDITVWWFTGNSWFILSIDLIYLCSQLYDDLSSNLNRLLHNSSDDLWTTGWIFAMVQDRAAFIYDGMLGFLEDASFNSPLFYHLVLQWPLK